MQDSNSVEPYVSLATVASFLNSSKQFVRLHSSGGRAPIIPHVRIGSRLKFKLSELREYIARQNNQVVSTEQN